ncbi:MAG TPA: hypothetical protein VJP45_02690, partial [Candidatus Limnocylindria bacterium]|nr:hypothetical protein [Candidatus Limnocylindria bacterium]
DLKRNPCVDCGGVFHPAAMTFDHRPGTTKVADLASLAHRGCTGLFDDELEKCDLVCANCHAVRTYQRREQMRAAANSLSEPVAAYLVAAA